MKRFVILMMVIALAIDLSYASVLSRSIDDGPIGEPKIISIDVDEIGLYKNGSITVHFQNTGEESEMFDIYFGTDCYPFEDSYSSADTLVKVLPGEIGSLSLPVNMNPNIRDKMVSVGNANDCHSAQFYNDTVLNLENERLCMPNKLYMNKTVVKQCNEFGTDSDVVASCKRNVTCEVIVYNKIVDFAGIHDGMALGNLTFELDDAICVPDKVLTVTNIAGKGYDTITICSNSGYISRDIFCVWGAVYDKERGDFICSPTPERYKKYKNIDNPDCDDAFNYFDADLNACVQKPVCPSVIKNGNSEQKIDVIFVGDGYSRDKELKADVLKIVGSAGLKSVEPFKSNWDEFNVWMINGGYRIPEDLDGGPDRSTSLEVASGCPFGDYQVILSEKSFRSYAYFSGDAYLSLGATPENEWGRLFLHEFGHSFGKLADEYVEPRLGNWPRQPNCAPNAETAREWWGGVPGTAFYDGCSYTETNVRPTFNSIMRDHWVLEDGYGEINKAALLKLLDKYTG